LAQALALTAFCSHECCMAAVAELRARGLPKSPTRPSTPRYGTLLQVPSRRPGAAEAYRALRRYSYSQPVFAKESGASLAEAAVSTVWCDRSRASSGKKAFESRAIQHRSAKHRQILQDSRTYHAAAAKIQRQWRKSPPRRVALLRLIYHEARKRHQQRESYQARVQLYPETYNCNSQDASKLPEASIWQLMQCQVLFREVLQDVHQATKICTTADGSVKLLSSLSKASAEKRSRLRDIRRRTWIKLSAVGAMTSILDAQRCAQDNWEKLRRCTMTPKASFYAEAALDFCQ